MRPLEICSPALKEDTILGKELIAKGKMGCIILAGGLGERLGHPGPKGTFSIKGKSLFQTHLEKAKGSVAIMTSSFNHEETASFLKRHAFFGAPQVDLFMQGNIQNAPDGNGNALKNFFRSGLWEKWKSQGIEFVRVILIDNPLADPFDAEVCGAAFRTQADIVIQAIERKKGEKVGAFALQEEKIKIIEYMELPADLTFPLGNSGLFCFSIDFIPKIKDVILPLHSVKNNRLETFIFDLLDYAQSVELLLTPRERCFAPIKSKADII